MKRICYCSVNVVLDTKGVKKYNKIIRENTQGSEELP